MIKKLGMAMMARKYHAPGMIALCLLDHAPDSIRASVFILSHFGYDCLPMPELCALGQVKLCDGIAEVSLGTLGRPNKLLNDLSTCVSPKRAQQPRRRYTACA